jgi:hypothetical protein
MGGRRLGALAAIAVAAFASLATSAVMPTPVPFEGLSGVVELTGARPAAAIEIEAAVHGLERVTAQDPPPGAELTARANAATPEGGGEVVVRVVPVEAAADDSPPDRFELGDPVTAAEPRWVLPCERDACRRRFMLLAEWLGAPPDGQSSVAWTLTGQVVPPSYGPAARPDLRSTLALGAGGPPVAVAAATGGSEAVTLEDVHEAAWLITMRLAEGDLPIDPGWPLLAEARLSTVVERPASRTDKPDEVDVVLEGYERNAGDRIESRAGSVFRFDPFARCSAGEPCEAVFSLQLARRALTDGLAPAVGWMLDVRSLRAGGEAIGVSVEIERVDAGSVPATSGSVAP